MPPTPAESTNERARMGRISGVLWIVAALIGVGASFLPGARPVGVGWILAMGVVVLAYGVGSVTGLIPWQRASMTQLGIGMVLTIPVVGLALYLSGGSLSYIEPLMVCSLLYAGFFFPPRWAWPLVAELVLVGATPLLYDSEAIDNGYLPRLAVLAAAYFAATWVMVGLKRRLVEAEARQRAIAHRDPLTGVGNRRSFDAIIEGELAARNRPRGGRREADRTPLALLIFDLDDFKGVNDHHGHQVGDAVLCAAAARAHAMLRSTDTLARIGGDEFAVIAPGAHGDGVRRMAESIRTAISLGDPPSGAPIPTASIGWAVFPDDGTDLESLMHSADERLLSLKRGSGQLALDR